MEFRSHKTTLFWRDEKKMANKSSLQIFSQRPNPSPRRCSMDQGDKTIKVPSKYSLSNQRFRIRIELYYAGA